MKHLFTALLLIFSISVLAQPNKHRVNPISNFAFQQLLSNVKSKPDDAQKLELAKRIANENRLLSDQVKALAELFANDYSRLEFAQQAYTNTMDKDNFYEVYNSFAYFSTVFRLHDYIAEQKGENKVINNEPDIKVMSFPSFDYPDFKRYFGKIGCTSIISELDFTNLAEKVFNERGEERKLAVANNIATNYCLQTSQAMKIASLLQNEQYRFEYLKKSYSKIYDPDNYKYTSQLFTNEKIKKDLLDITVGSEVGKTNNIPVCEVSAKEFTEIKNQITKQSFSNTKLNVAKESIRSKKCFKTSQIIELLSLLSYSDSKMEVAKFAYDFTTDKDNYFKIADAFTFSSDKDIFLEFLKNKN